jgi:choloylglycine hydrolase
MLQASKLLFGLVLAVAPVAADSCTRVLWNNNKLAVVTSRTMDWPESTLPRLWVLPRGLTHDGAMFAGAKVVAENAARWTSKYASVITSAYDVGTIDGLNEKGLGVHLLYLSATDFGPRDPGRKGIQAGLWGQYLLDNAETVAEALALMEKIQPVMVEIHGHRTNLHLAIEDASGDSAIVEFVNGKPLVHHGRQFRVMTNDPPFDDQLKFLSGFDFTNATRKTPLPGNVDPTHRFVRATYFQQKLPEPKDDRAAVAGVMAVARVVSVPFGAPNNLPGTLYNTEYRTVVDSTNKRYFFELSDAPNVIWLNLASFDLSAGAPVRRLDPADVANAGDVAAKFVVADAPF